MTKNRPENQTKIVKLKALDIFAERNKAMYRCVNQHIRTPEELGIAYLGNPKTAIVPIPRKNLIDRAEYGRKLAKLENGIFTPFGYFVPIKDEGRNK